MKLRRKRKKEKKIIACFYCNECDSKFTTQSDLKIHGTKFGHKVVEEYSVSFCDDCNKAFVGATNLLRHKKLEHEITINVK